MPPPNTSATGGFLVPTGGITPPVEGKALYDVLTRLVVGITSMDQSLVRPRWQTEPPSLPATGTLWAAVGVVDRRADTYPLIEHLPTGGPDALGSDVLRRNEELDVIVSFYGLGNDGGADVAASLLRDGLAIAQNREGIDLEGFKIGAVGKLTPLPVIVKSRWMYRIDLDFTLRRQIAREYPVENLLSADIVAITEDLPPIEGVVPPTP